MTKPLFPKSALAHHIAVLGKTGSGKTSVVKASVIEPALEDNERMCVIDPTGAWWGLRLMADGRRKGFPVYVFGGRHADYPLLGTHGEAMADVIGTTNTPAILDTSLMKISERVRFFTDFADAILRKNEGPLRIVIDEAHVFMPQSGTRGGGPVPDMLHAGNNLISLGRSRGLRIVLISQRAAKLHKDSLTQVETMICCRLLAPQDRKAFKEWIDDQANEEDGKDIIASLPRLAAGEAWVWAPEADFLKRIQFPLPITFDSSAAPSKNAAAKKLSPIDLDALKDRLAKVDADAKANDPKALRAEIAMLKAEKLKLENQKPAKPAPDKDALKTAEQKGFDQAKKKFGPAATRALNKAMAGAIKAVEERLRGLVKDVLDDFKELRQAIPGLDAELKFEPSAPAVDQWTPDEIKRFRAAQGKKAPAPVVKMPPVAKGHTPRIHASDGEPITGPQRQLLQALAWWREMGHAQPTRVQVASICGWRITSGHLKNVSGSLRSRGLIDYPTDGTMALTASGAEMTPPPDTSTSLEDSVRAILTGPQRQAFDVLPTDGAAMSREHLADACGWNITSGHVKNVLGSMRSLEVIEYPSQGTVARADWLRMEKAA